MSEYKRNNGYDAMSAFDLESADAAESENVENAEYTSEFTDLVSESTVAEVKGLVAEGSLTAEEVYAAEKNGKNRQTLLDLYGPDAD